MRSIPVLMYHHVLPEEGFLSISQNEFERQIKFFATRGYRTLISKEFLEFKKGSFLPQEKCVFITFDDGWRDLYYFAYPVLKKYGLKATVFLVTSWVERASKKTCEFIPYPHKTCKQLLKTHPEKVVLNWNEIEKMRDVFDFHSHTHTHFEARIPIEKEFLLSKEILKTRLGVESVHLCWPRGEYNSSLLALAKAYDYKIFYTTQRGVNLPDGNLNEIKRIAVKKNLLWLAKTLFIFSNKVFGKIYASIKS